MATWGTGLSLRGLPGADGIRGAQTFFITGAPTDSNASAYVGDTAFATDTFRFYQRTADGWPAEGSLLQGPMGFNGVDGFFGSGPDAPTDAMGQGANGFYFQASGEVWIRQASGPWQDSGQNLVGPQGIRGETGIRGSQIYKGIGAPPSDISTLTPPGAANDVWFDVDPNNSNAPVLYFLTA